MSTVIVASVAAYLMIGLAFVFIGPVARQRRREMFRAAILQPPAWKLLAFGTFISIGIVILWPFIVPSSMKHTNTALADDNAVALVAKASPEAANMIAAIEAGEPRIITLNEYNSIGRGLAFSDECLIREAMEQRGFLVALATTPEGRTVPATFNVASMIGARIVLIEDRPGEWSFTTSDESWQHLAGRAGRAAVKNGVVVSIDVSIMS